MSRESVALLSGMCSLCLDGLTAGECFEDLGDAEDFLKEAEVELNGRAYRFAALEVVLERRPRMGFS